MFHRLVRALCLVVCCVLASAPLAAQLRGLAREGDFAGAEAGRATAGGLDLDGDGRPDFLVGGKGNPAYGPGAGKVWVYNSDGVLLHTFVGDAIGDEFGSGVAILPDVDGDGANDILIGARGAGGAAGPRMGRAYLYHGVTPGHLHDWQLIATWCGAVAGEEFGNGVASVGDVDGDGHADFMVGAPRSAASAAGIAYLFSGATLAPLHVYTEGHPVDAFGYSVGSVGDLDNDGFPEVGVGAIFADAPTAITAGALYVYHTITPQHAYDYVGIAAVYGEHFDDRFGLSFAGVGDVNGDGYPDIVVGASRWEPAGVDVNDNRGKAYVFSGHDGTTLFTFEGPEDRDWAGIGVGAAGDVDGDGYPDVLVGACQTEKGGTGRAFVLRGSPRPVGQIGGLGELMFSMEGEFATGIPHMGDAFGFTVTGIGDVDGSGASSFVVGAYGFDNATGQNAGKVYLWSSAVHYHGIELPAPNLGQLRVPVMPRLGAASGIYMGAVPPFAPGLLAFSPDRAVFPFAGGLLLADPSAAILMPVIANVNGLAVVSVPIPSDPQILGFTGHFQAAFLDPQQVQGVVITNLATVLVVR